MPSDSYYDWQRKFSKKIENGNLDMTPEENSLGIKRSEFEQLVKEKIKEWKAPKIEDEK